LPSAFIQPILADDVAAALADVTLGAPVNGIIDLAGPERFRFDEIIPQFMSATQDTRQVVRDMKARYFGAKLDEQAIVPRGASRIGATRFEDWLRRDVLRAPGSDHLVSENASASEPANLLAIHIAEDGAVLTKRGNGK
jgi:uncharacterized protein YbjT (DUF2867 family)